MTQQTVIRTAPIGNATYGPFTDGRRVADVVHVTDMRRLYRQDGYQFGQPPKLDWELTTEDLQRMSKRCGSGWLAEYAGGAA